MSIATLGFMINGHDLITAFELDKANEQAEALIRTPQVWKDAMNMAVDQFAHKYFAVDISVIQVVWSYIRSVN